MSRPIPANKPAPGIYWIRQTDEHVVGFVDANGVRVENAMTQPSWGVWAWAEESDWVLAAIDANGDFLVIGDEVEDSWESDHRMVTTVGPKVEKPQ